MEMLDKANTETYGTPTTVSLKVVVALSEAFHCGVNKPPLTLVLSWYKQKDVCILLTLLHLRIKNIYLGPTPCGRRFPACSTYLLTFPVMDGLNPRQCPPVAQSNPDRILSVFIPITMPPTASWYKKIPSQKDIRVRSNRMFVFELIFCP